MDDSPAGSIILFLLLILASAYFSGTEISLASVNRIHMMSRASKGNKGAKRVLKILDNFDEALSVLLIGNNVVNIGCATLSAVIAAQIWGPAAVSASTVITTVVIFIFGEMLPKCFARSCNERFAETSSAILTVLMKVIKPLSFFFTSLSSAVSKPFRKHAENQVTMTEDELNSIVENISEEDGFDEETGRLVKSAMKFSNSSAREVMVPWEQVLKISTSLKTAQILEVINGSPHSRIPVTDRDGNIKGILQIRKFLKAYIKQKHNVILASVIDYPYYVSADTPIDELLTEMSNHRRNLAVVKDNDGTVLGIITVEDIMEELVGEIYDEDDAGGVTPMNESLRYLAIVLLILLSAFFSATEIAFASVNSARLKAMRQKKDTLALSLAAKIVDDYENMLGAVLIGNNLVNIAASSIATLIVMDYLGAGYAWVATLVMTLLVLTFGEIIPKVLAKQFAESFSVAVAIPIYVLSVILRPITIIMMAFINLVSKLWQSSVADSDAVSEDDFENIIDIVEDEGVLDEEQCDLLQNALDFDTVLAYEVVTPRVDMEAIDIHDPYEKNVKKILDSTYSRLPVFEDTPDNIIGILHLNHFYKEYVANDRVNIRSLLLPVTYVHKTMPLPDVLEKMKDSKSHMVVVLDEYGGTMGILTMEDVLEQLVGEIWDETDEIEREFVCIDDTHFETDGDMRLYDFFDEFDIDIDEDENFEYDDSTVGGWTMTMLDGEASKGDSFIYKNLKITVIKAEEHRVWRVAVEKLPEEENQDE